MGPYCPMTRVVYRSMPTVSTMTPSLEVVTSGSRELVQGRQNIVLETNGGTVDRPEVGGVTTEVGAFLPSSLGFTGLAHNGQKIGDYILDSVTSIMQQSFDSVVVSAGADAEFGTADDVRGLDINVSTNPADFEFQDFSTIFLSSTLDPIDPVIRIDTLGFFTVLGAQTDAATQGFGVSERSDPGNADRNDELHRATVALNEIGEKKLPPGKAVREQRPRDLVEPGGPGPRFMPGPGEPGMGGPDDIYPGRFVPPQ